MTTETRLTATPTLKAVIEHQGRSIQWMAGRLGIGHSMVSLIVSEKRTVSMDRAQRVSDLLGVPVELIFAPMTEIDETAKGMQP